MIMEQILLFTDSASDMIPPYARQLRVLPMTVSFGEQSFRDGVELSHRSFYEKLVESDTLPTTSLIGPGIFSEAFREAVDRGNSVVVVTISSCLSGTYQSAVLAAEDFPGKVFVVDSRNAAIGERILVEYGLRLVRQGLSAEEIAEKLTAARDHVHILAVLDTLEYLKKGGRISKTVAFFGEAMAIKPVVTVRDGVVAVLGKARGSRNGNNFLMQETEKVGGVNFAMPYALGYSGLSDAGLKKYMADSKAIWADHAEALPVYTIGATIGTHVGPGAIAVAFFDHNVE